MEFLVLAGLVLVIAYVWYISLITRRNKVREAFAGIDVQLRKRHDLIPNILTIAQKFMEHERDLLEEVTRLRAAAITHEEDRAPSAEKFALEAALQRALGQLMVNVENYPQLKSDAAMLQAQATYNEVEEHIAASRRFYNSAVTALLNAKQIWPGSIFANFAGIEDFPFYEAEEMARAPVRAADFLKRSAPQA